MSPLNNPSVMVRTSTGQYVGDDTANRAIPHGLGVKPILVNIIDAGNAGLRLILKDDQLNYLSSSTNPGFTVTAKDADNFYVGNSDNYNQSANGNGTTYYWVAIA